MAKEAYYFSHDSNARHDPKITAMRSVYGTEGYGWFWIIVELMREADEYKLEMQGRYTFNAYAMQMHTECNTAERFITDCINEFNLFASDGEYFWSPSLLRRMDLREQTSEKRREAANARWKKQKKNANASNLDANAMQGKERKVNKKENNIPDSDESFNRFWSLYPKKQGKANAQKRWSSYEKEGQINIDKILQGTNDYIAFVEHERKRGFDRQFMDGATFVNQQRWNDDWKVQNNVAPFERKNESVDSTTHRMNLQKRGEQLNEPSTRYGS